MKLYVTYRESPEFQIIGVQTDFPGKSTHYEEFELTGFNLYDFVDSDEVYVLYMIYTTGDSFSACPGNGDIIWVFKDKELGIAAAKKFREHTDSDESRVYSVEFEVDGGRIIKLPNQAKGHFESLERLSLLTFRVNHSSSMEF